MDAKSGIVHHHESCMSLRLAKTKMKYNISRILLFPWVWVFDWVQKTRKCKSSLIMQQRAVQRGVSTTCSSSSEKVPLIWQFLPWPALHLQPLKISILRCNVATAQATALESNIQFESFWIATKRTLEWCECANYEAWCVHEFEVWQLWQSIIWPPPFEWDDVSERIQGSNNAHNL